MDFKLTKEELELVCLGLAALMYQTLEQLHVTEAADPRLVPHKAKVLRMIEARQDEVAKLQVKLIQKRLEGGADNLKRLRELTKGARR